MKTSLKEVKVTARYAHKTNGKFNGLVTYAVRSSNGEVIYCTTLINGKASGCSCPSHKPCYHMHQLEEREWARYRAEVARKMAAQYMTTETVEQIAEQLVAPKQVKIAAPTVVSPIAMDLPEELRGRGKRALAGKPGSVAYKGNLNGAAQSASFWSELPSRKTA